MVKSGNNKINTNYKEVFQWFIRNRHYEEQLSNDFRKDETQKLVQLYQNNGLSGREKEETREKILELNFPFIFRDMIRSCKSYGRLDLFESVLSRGIFLYLSALNKYDSERGVLFTTYAGSRLIGAISREFSKEKQGKRYEDASLEAIAEAGHVFGDKGDSVEEAEEAVNRQDLRDRIEEGFDYISNKKNGERVVEVLRRVYFQEQTLDEIGEDLGITRERVRQLKEQGKTLMKRYYNHSDVVKPNI